MPRYFFNLRNDIDAQNATVRTVTFRDAFRLTGV
jgi:hypothetical protein